MRRVLAGLVDVGLVAILTYIAFRLALWATPCGNNLANCFPLAPAIVVSVLLALTLYFGLSYLAWKTTPGQRLFHTPAVVEDELP